MSLTSLRAAVVDALKTGVPALVDVHTHGGRFDAGELKRWATRAPCAVVAVLGVPSVADDSGQEVAEIALGCFLIARDTPQARRDEAALALLAGALGVIRPGAAWGDASAHGATQIRADNLFSGTLDQTGVAIWAVTWRQPYDLEAAAVVDDLLTTQSAIDLVESLDATPETTDTITLGGTP